MKKFKYPLAIEGSREELEALIPELEKLGYKNKVDWAPDDTWVITSWAGQNGVLQSMDDITSEMRKLRPRTELKASQKDLILALAAMVDGEEFHKGELCYWSGFDARFVTLVQRSEDWKHCWTTDVPGYTSCHENNLRKATKEEIIEHFNKTTMKDDTSNSGSDLRMATGVAKKIIGYRLRPQFQNENGRRYASLIVFGNDRWLPPALNDFIGIDRDEEIQNLKDASVLYLWFEPVYEEKKKVEIITLRSEKGPFELEVSKEGIYYRAENKWLFVPDIEDIISVKRTVRYKHSPKSPLIQGNHFDFKFTHVDSGCKPQVPIEDWEKVMKAFNELQK